MSAAKKRKPVKGPVMMPEVQMTPKELELVHAVNKLHAEIYATPPAPEVPAHPGVARLVAEAHLMELRETHREAGAKALSKIQSDHNKKRRPKGSQDTVPSLVIAEMRRYRRDEGGRLKDFLEADFDTITIEPKGGKFLVICEAIAPPRKNNKLVGSDTLWKWFGKAS